MYIPSSFAELDVSTLHAFVEAHPFATLITASPPTGLFATHLPLVLDRAVGPFGSLIGHLARANPHAAQLALGEIDALVIFSGADAYITPAWYPTKRETGRVVPTWNYVAVHAYGTLQSREDPQFLRQHLEALTTRHEENRTRPWSVGDAPEEFVANQMKAIVGFEFVVSRLEGKWKMSQNRSAADIDGVIDGLGSSDVERDHVAAAIVGERRPRR